MPGYAELIDKLRRHAQTQAQERNVMADLLEDMQGHGTPPPSRVGYENNAYAEWYCGRGAFIIYYDAASGWGYLDAPAMAGTVHEGQTADECYAALKRFLALPLR